MSAHQGFPGSSVVKNLPANAGDVGLTPGLGGYPGGGNGNQLHCLQKSHEQSRLAVYSPWDRKKSDTNE